MNRSLPLALLICALLIGAANGSEFRSIQRIPTRTSRAGATTAGTPARQSPASQLKDLSPIRRQVVESAVRQLLESWNSADMAALIDNGFVDRSRFLDASGDKVRVPADATIRLVSTRGIRTLTRRLEEDPPGQYAVVTTVSVTITTQIEFNDAVEGFQRIEGKNELILDIAERLE